MKLLQINATYGRGSTGKITKDIHELAKSNGIDSYVACMSSVDPEETYMVGTTFDHKAHALLCRINGKQAYFSKGATKKLLKYIEDISPDVVQLHNLHSNYIHLNILLKFLAEKNIKTVITLHDCWFFTGGCFHYTAVKCDKWLHECGKCPKKNVDTPAYLFDKSSNILADRKEYFDAIPNVTVVGVSKWISNQAKKSFLGSRRVVTIHNGIDCSVFHPTPSDFREKHGLNGKFVILALASKWLLDINKETFDFVTDNLPSDCVMVMIGGTCKKELPKNVISLPFISSQKELCEIYSAADVFANCTREDSLSLASIEPQACGTPVITYQNTGTSETVNNKCGYAVENGNAKAMLEKILYVKSIGKAALSDACREWAVNNFSYTENYKEYIDLFFKL